MRTRMFIFRDTVWRNKFRFRRKSQPNTGIFFLPKIMINMYRHTEHTVITSNNTSANITIITY